jgi:hypothetical protein
MVFISERLNIFMRDEAASFFGVLRAALLGLVFTYSRRCFLCTTLGYYSPGSYSDAKERLAALGRLSATTVNHKTSQENEGDRSSPIRDRVCCCCCCSFSSSLFTLHSLLLRYDR